MKFLIFLLVFLFSAPYLPDLNAQYFGRNKPNYDQFDFKVYETPSFEIYHYLEDEALLRSLANQSEMWYRSHSRLLKDTIPQRNPLIFYSHHADFQQTNAISSLIGAGVGGVTESLRNRVIMPLTLSNQKTFQILGHELVHAFQYNLILRNEEMSPQNLGNIPLYVIEGKAEYLTRGRDDPFTAMWMRDAVLQDDIPGFRDMNRPKYFPYRYGQAFWAFLTGIYGDAVIHPLFMAVAELGMKEAFPRVVNRSMEEVSEEFKTTLKEYYTNILEDGDFGPSGRKLITDENAGLMNVSPTVSPNGRYVIFLSEKDLFTIDLYLADTRDGKIIRKIASSARYSDIDHMDVIESTGTWSPDSRTFAYVGFKQGRNRLFLVDVETGKRLEEYEIPGLAFFSNPAWSPTGDVIAVSGLVDGRPDLFLFNLKTKRLENITNDNFSYLQPYWSNEASKIAVTTDRVSIQQGMENGKWTHNLAIIEVEDLSIQDLDIFPGADNFNPVFDQDDQLWFLSDRDGFRDVYLYHPESDSVYQQTKIATGVSGITSFAPAISMARRIDRVMYTVYEGGNYFIYSARQDAFRNISVDKADVDQKGAGQLPVTGRIGLPLSDAGLSQISLDEFPDTLSYRDIPFDSKFSLVAASQSMGVGVGSGTMGSGTQMGGGVQLLFSDILGDHQLFTTLFMNGEIYDIGLVGTYINRTNRINWGVSLSHIPYRTAFSSFGQAVLPGTENEIVPIIRTDILRIFEEQLSFMAAYPFNVTTRVEGSIGTSYRFFRLDQITDYYTPSGFFIGREREKIPIEGDLFLGNSVIKKAFTHNVGSALVGDNSFFGMTSPLRGYRYRLGYDRFFGGYDFNAFTADARKYFLLRPFTLAFRGFHYSRFGRDAESFFPIFIGQMGMVRGYSLSGREFGERYDLRVDQVTGSKVLLGSAEIRLPFTGPERLALISSGFLFTDLNLFFDIGVAFDDYGKIGFEDAEPDEAAVLMSTGLSMRINLFGALIVEPYYAIPLREGGKGTFGFNFIPGW
nr:PD40 domain-containing protein [Saprospiraceae bacterium]